VSQHLYSQAGAQAGQPGTLEKERRTCLSFLIFGKSNQSAALSPNLFFTAKDAKERPASGISVGIQLITRRAIVFSGLLYPAHESLSF
jgi:hypothetical protein